MQTVNRNSTVLALVALLAALCWVAPAAAAPDWPSNRDGLTYLWKNASATNVILDKRTGLSVTTTLSGDGQVAPQYNQFGAAIAVGRSFIPSSGSPARISDGVVRTHQFSFEIVVASADLGHPERELRPETLHRCESLKRTRQ